MFGILSIENPGFLVRWISWDSDFRRELQVGDRIVQFNNENIAPFLKPGLGTGIGQYAEYSHWKDVHAIHNKEISLSVLRQGKPVTVKGP